MVEIVMLKYLLATEQYSYYMKCAAQKAVEWKSVLCEINCIHARCCAQGMWHPCQMDVQ